MNIRALLIGIALLMPLSQAFAEKMQIAIMDFDAKDIPRKEAEKISELIRSEMVSVGEFTVIERNQMDKILKEQGFQQTGCTDISCAVNIGKMLSARKILVGSLMKIAGQIVISGRIVDVEKGVADFGEKEQVRDQDDLYGAVERFVRKFAMKISIKSDADKYTKKESSKTKFTGPYGWLSLSFGLAGAAPAAVSVLYYIKLKATNKDYNKTKSNYYISTGGLAAYYHLQMDTKRKNALSQEKIMMYTAIGAGTLGAAALSFLIVHIVKNNQKAGSSGTKVGMVDNVIFTPYFNVNAPLEGIPNRKDTLSLGMQCFYRY